MAWVRLLMRLAGREEREGAGCPTPGPASRLSSLFSCSVGRVELTQKTVTLIQFFKENYIPHLWDMEKEEKDEGSSLPSWCGSVCSAAEGLRVELGAGGCCCCWVQGFEPPATVAAAAGMLRLLLASLTPLVLSVLARVEEAARVLRLDLCSMVS